VFGAGHPDFEVSYSWNEEEKLAEIAIEQKQTQGKLKVVENDATTYLFSTPITLDVTLENGEKLARTIVMKEAKERVFIAAPMAPKMVRFDPGAYIPKNLKFTRPKAMMIYQLENDPDCMGRIEAAQSLGKMQELDVVKALEKAMLGDKFWAVQYEAAAALGEIRLDAARDVLIAAIPKMKNSKSRRGVIKSLGTFKDAKSAAALKAVAEKDESYFVEADATSAYLSSRLASSMQATSKDVDEAEAFFLKQLEKSSYREVIRRAAYRALSWLPGIERGERPKALQALIEGTRSKLGASIDARVGALMSVGRLASRSVPAQAERLLGVLNEYLDEKNYFVRMTLVSALEETGLPGAIGALEQLRTIDSDGRIKRHARWAVESIESGLSKPESIEALRKDFETLQSEYQKLRTAIEDLKAKSSPQSSLQSSTKAV
jgi:aminopeptidase N